MDFFTFWLLWIIHVQVFMWIYIVTSFRNIHRSGCGHMVTLCLSFWVTARFFSKGAMPFYIPTSNIWAISLPPHQHLSLSVYFDSNHSTEFEAVSHCGFHLPFPMANDVSYLSMCLLRIFLSWRNAHLGSLPLFVVLLLSCKCSLDILDTSSLSDRWFTNVFS